MGTWDRLAVCRVYAAQDAVGLGHDLYMYRYSDIA